MQNDVKVIADTTKINERYDLSVIQLLQLKEISNVDMFEAFVTAFRVGYAMGSRAMAADIKRKRMKRMDSM